MTWTISGHQDVSATSLDVTEQIFSQSMLTDGFGQGLTRRLHLPTPLLQLGTTSPGLQQVPLLPNHALPKKNSMNNFESSRVSGCPIGQLIQIICSHFMPIVTDFMFIPQVIWKLHSQTMQKKTSMEVKNLVSDCWTIFTRMGSNGTILHAIIQNLSCVKIQMLSWNMWPPQMRELCFNFVANNVSVELFMFLNTTKQCSYLYTFQISHYKHKIWYKIGIKLFFKGLYKGTQLRRF